MRTKEYTSCNDTYKCETIRRWTSALVLCVVGLFGGLATAQGRPTGHTLQVDCNSGQTISNALAALKNNPMSASGPNTVLISGTCNEDVSISAMNNLTLQGNPTATINGSANGNGALFVTDLQNLTVNNIVITGSGVFCAAATCHFNNDTVQNTVGAGIVSGPSGFVTVNASTVQQNGGPGLQIHSNGNLVVAGSTVQGNAGAGISIQSGASLIVTQQAQGYILTGPANTVIQNNGTDGIFADVNSTVKVFFTAITGNGRDGLRIQGGSKALVGVTSITGNTGHGVRIGDLSFVEFGGGNNVSGNNSGAANPLDVVCDPQFSATRGLAALSGTTTNCAPEPPTNP